MKTHRAAAKRYKVTASGKIMRLSSGKKQRRMTGMTEVSETNLKLVSRELPYKRYSR